MSDGGFSSPATDGGGGLILPAIHSPGYTAGVSGWTINKDGTVEFNSGVFRGTITAGTFEGTTFEINSSGFFLYSGPPALGNLVANISPTGGVDAFGNTYHAVVSAGTQGGAYTRIGTTGIIHMTNSAGADVLQFDPTRSAIMLYSGAPALGNLVGSIAAFPVTDALGNHLLAGVSQYDPGGSNTYVNLDAGQISIGQIVAHVPDTAHASTMFAGEFIGPTDSTNTVAPTFFQAQGQPAATLSSGFAPVEQHYATSTTPLLDILVGALVFGSINGLGAVVAETWQTPTIGGGFNNGGFAGEVNTRYRRDASDNLVLPIAVTAAGAIVAGTSSTIFTLPAAYRPAKGMRFAAYQSTGNGVYASVVVQSGGAVIVQNPTALVANNVVECMCVVPLGNIG